MDVPTRRLAVLLACVLASACAGPSGPGTSSGGQPTAPSQPKRVVVGIQSTPPTISSQQVGAGSGTLQGGDGLEDLMNAGMGVLDNKGNVSAQLAEQIPSLENGLWKLLPDGRMETTWKIRSDAVWHDGAPLTVEDLLFTITIGQDRTIPALRNPAFDLFESVEAPDPHIVVITWRQPFIE